MPPLNGVVDLTADSSSSSSDADFAKPLPGASRCDPPLRPKKRPRHGDQAESIGVLQAELAACEEEVDSLRAALSFAESRKVSLTKRLRSARDALAARADAGLDWTGPRPWDDLLRNICRETLGAPSFRPLQLEALNGTLARRDVFAVMPTGAGKSLIYQAAGLVDGGVTLVVSPLLALSEDQRSRLAQRGVCAEALDSNTPKEVAKRIFSNVLPAKGVAGSRAVRKRLRAGDAFAGASNAVKWERDEMNACILFVTPERIVKSKRLMSRLEIAYEAGHLSRIAIDEAHCCSHWGHDFRPDYAKIGVLRRQLPETPILMLSATASPRVIEDVKKILETPRCVVFRSSIDRSNLKYSVKMLDTELTPGMTVAELVQGRFAGQCGIVYVLSRKDAGVVANELRTYGVAAAAYHADLESTQRGRVHENWMRGRVRVVVATVAFGLGIDNQNVRFVIHACIPPSLEAYYQESGRAGRDGEPAECVALFRASDFGRMSSFVADKGPSRLKLLYDMCKYALGFGDCRREMLAQAFGEKRPERNERDVESCCDMCSGDLEDIVMLDVTKEAQSLVRILDFMSTECRDDKITINRAATDWANTGAKGKRFRGPGNEALGREFDKETRMMIIVALITHGAVREYHNYNTYSLNGYIAVGETAQVLLDGNMEVQVPVKTSVGSSVRRGRSLSK